MVVEWQIDSRDVKRVKSLLRKQAYNALVRYRVATNLAEVKRPIERGQFWYQMVSMRLTSIQRSGPDSFVSRFARTHPFPLDYQIVRRKTDPEQFIASTLKRAGGIRFIPTIARQLASNLKRLEAGDWEEALNQCNRLTTLVPREVERDVANYIDTFEGFGPKQARNFLQALGLTRFEIPIDSRVTAWLNDFGFPVKLSPKLLADNGYYCFVSDRIQKLCALCGVFPCVLDAAIFALNDGKGWTDEIMTSISGLPAKPRVN